MVAVMLSSLLLVAQVKHWMHGRAVLHWLWNRGKVLYASPCSMGDFISYTLSASCKYAVSFYNIKPLVVLSKVLLAESLVTVVKVFLIFTKSLFTVVFHTNSLAGNFVALILADCSPWCSVNHIDRHICQFWQHWRVTVQTFETVN